jgi:hypothetical protein
VSAVGGLEFRIRSATISATKQQLSEMETSLAALKDRMSSNGEQAHHLGQRIEIMSINMQRIVSLVPYPSGQQQPAHIEALVDQIQEADEENDPATATSTTLSLRPLHDNDIASIAQPWSSLECSSSFSPADNTAEKNFPTLAVGK